jgi:uncharacterized protein YjiS (DUF1127 family)
MSGFTYPSLTNSQVSTLPRQTAAKRRPGLFARAWATLKVMRQRSRERRALADLTVRELADFGANTSDVYRELNTPFWSIPPL